jgi:pimeloyl-ACP methyl ester carboxylesterase
VKTLADSLAYMAGFPFSDLARSTFEGPTLFVRGSRSHYVKDSTLSSIEQFFPKFQLRDVAAGHWVMAENPEAFKKGIYTRYSGPLFVS